MNNQPSNDSTVGMPPLDLLKLQILQRRSDALQQISNYVRREHRSGTAPAFQVHSTIEILYYELEPSLNRWLSTDEFNDLRQNVLSINFVDNLKAFRTINHWLDAKRITRIDLEKTYESTDTEAENEAKGV